MQDITQVAGNVTLRMFDPVIVQVSSERSSIQHSRLRLRLVMPLVRITIVYMNKHQINKKRGVEMDGCRGRVWVCVCGGGDGEGIR